MVGRVLDWALLRESGTFHPSSGTRNGDDLQEDLEPQGLAEVLCWGHEDAGESAETRGAAGSTFLHLEGPRQLFLIGSGRLEGGESRSGSPCRRRPTRPRRPSRQRKEIVIVSSSLSTTRRPLLRCRPSAWKISAREKTRSVPSRPMRIPRGGDVARQSRSRPRFQFPEPRGPAGTRAGDLARIEPALVEDDHNEMAGEEEREEGSHTRSGSDPRSRSERRGRARRRGGGRERPEGPAAGLRRLRNVRADSGVFLPEVEADAVRAVEGGDPRAVCRTGRTRIRKAQALPRRPASIRAPKPK